MDVIDKNWYKNWFGNEYLTVYAHRDDTEAARLVDFIQKNINISQQALILDLCCGQGRHAILLAGLGYHVVGIDLSRTLLELAKYSAKHKDYARFVQADMRFLPSFEKFDLLLNLFTSFGYFESDEENLAVFNEFHTVLKTGGYFVFDYLNADHVENNLIPFHREKLGDLMIEQERYIDGSRVQKKISLNKCGYKSVFYESVKLYRPEQIMAMLNRANLSTKNIYGDYDGCEFEKDSPRFIIIGKSISSAPVSTGNKSW